MDSVRLFSRSSMSQLVACAAVCAVTALLLGCRGSAPEQYPIQGPGGTAARTGFSLDVMTDALIGSSTFSLNVSEHLGQVVVTVSAANANQLKAVYFELGFDEGKYTPVAAESTGLLAGGLDPLSLTVCKAAGVLQHGEVLANWRESAGFSGAGVVASFAFRTTRDAESAGGRLLAVPGRISSSVPVANGARHYLNFNPEANVFLWYYVNPGDYDQNGEVGITDLTPLGANFNDEGPFSVSDARILVDGDGNGVINIADITTIGANFGHSIDSFGVYGSSDPADYPDANSSASGPGARVVGSRPFSLAHGGGTQRKYWDMELQTPVIGDGHYWVRPRLGNSVGTPSQLVSHSQQWHLAEVYDYDGDLQNLASISAAIVNGTPSMVLTAYRFEDAQGLFQKFVYCDAADKLGESWNPAVIINETSIGQQTLPRLAEVDGAPAYMWYSDISPFLLRYQRALDAGGTSWDTPVTIATVSYPQNTALLVYDGTPIAIFNSGNQLKASPALDVEGGTWLPATTLHTSVSNWWDRMGAVVLPGGFGLTFDDNLTGALNYVYTSVDGTTLSPGDPDEIFPGNAGSNFSVKLGLTDGKPFTLTKRANNRFYFSYATDALGADWTEPDVSGLTGQVYRMGGTGAYGLAWAMYFDDDTGYVRAGYGPADQSSPWSEVQPVVQYPASQGQVSELVGLAVGGHPAVAISQAAQNKVYFAVHY